MSGLIFEGSSIMASQQGLLSEIVGQEIGRLRVGRFRSLTVGFGKKVYHGNPKLLDRFNSKWEFISYSSSWRIVQNQRILAGKDDPETDYAKSTRRVRRIQFGKLVSITQPNPVDLTLTFSTGVAIEFFASSSDKDSYLNVFLPHDRVLSLWAGGKWTIETGSRPSRPKAIS